MNNKEILQELRFKTHAYTTAHAFATDHPPSDLNQTLTLLITPDEVNRHPAPPFNLIGGPAPFLWIQYYSKNESTGGIKVVYTWIADYTLTWSGIPDRKGKEDERVY